MRRQSIPMTGPLQSKGIRMLLRWLLLYAAVAVLAWIFQDRLLYFPSRDGLDRVEQAAAGRGLHLWPHADMEYLGLIPENTPPAARGTVIVFHGNTLAAGDRHYYVPPLTRRGFRTILAEYPGYGARGGRPGEAALVDDGRTIVRRALGQYGRPVYLWGESLGCGVACAVAAEQGLAVDGIVLLTPWSTLPDMAQARYWFLPARWMVRDRFDNIRNLQAYGGPVAILMAGRDAVIPNRLTQSLYRSLATGKRIWTFEGAGHNSWPADPDLAWWTEVLDFVSSRRPAPPRSP